MKVKCKESEMEVLEATVYLSDKNEHAGYNHPSLYIRVKSNSTYDQEWGFSINFQRNSIDNNHKNEKPAQYWTDTTQRWGNCYAARIPLEQSDIEILEHSFELVKRDQLKNAFAKKIRDAIEKYNIRYVEPDCELKRIVATLEKLGIPVDKIYCDRFGNQSSLARLENKYANHKYAQEQKEQDKAA